MRVGYRRAGAVRISGRPLRQGFAHVGTYELIVYFVTLSLASMSALCMIAPSAQHRFLFRHDDKRHIVFTSNRIVIAGLVFLAMAMCGCLLLVATYLFGVLAGLLTRDPRGAFPFAILWFAMPLLRRRKLDGAGGQPEDSRDRYTVERSGSSWARVSSGANRSPSR